MKSATTWSLVVLSMLAGLAGLDYIRASQANDVYHGCFGSAYKFCYYTDMETGMQYMVWQNGGIIPRMDQDGYPMRVELPN